jgi:hypothetical protein
MAVIGDFLGAAGGFTPIRQQHHTGPRVRNARVGGVVPGRLDPYARADFFISFGEEGVTSRKDS